MVVRLLLTGGLVQSMAWGPQHGRMHRRHIRPMAHTVHHPVSDVMIKTAHMRFGTGNHPVVQRKFKPSGLVA